MSTSNHKSTAAHRAFRDDAIALLRKHAGQLDGMDMLALIAHLVGQIIALQDQRKVTREMALQIVMQNIEQGNKEVFDSLGNTKGTS